MDEQLGVVEVPAIEEAAPEVEAPISLEDHEAQFGPNRTEAEIEAAEASPVVEAPAASTTEQQRREKETGRFTDGKTRHRAKSQQATAADVPRIQELNRKLKAATEQIERLSAAPVTQARPQLAVAPQHEPVQATPAPQVSAQRWIGDSKNDPEPQEKDFGGDPMKYLSARFQWEARGVNRYERHEAAQRGQQLERATSWAQRVEKAIANPKYPDYAAVAFGPTTIPSGSPMDQFIDGDDNGAEVLYHLQSNPAERDAVLRLPVIQQMKHLALLSQRYDTASTPSEAAVSTTSAPRSNVRFLPPRPPNVVRTEAQRGDSAPPSSDGTLAGHEKQYGPRRR